MSVVLPEIMGVVLFRKGRAQATLGDW